MRCSSRPLITKSTIEAHHQGIETEIAWHVASHNELLAETDSVFGP